MQQPLHTEEKHMYITCINVICTYIHILYYLRIESNIRLLTHNNENIEMGSHNENLANCRSDNRVVPP